MAQNLYVMENYVILYFTLNTINISAMKWIIYYMFSSNSTHRNEFFNVKDLQEWIWLEMMKYQEIL
jgi:hypothetical protein